MTYVIFLPSPTPSHCTVHWCQIHSPWLRDIVDYIPCCGLRIGFLYTTFFCTTIPSSIVTSFYLWTLSAVLWICIGFNMDPEPALYINADPDPRFLWPEIKILFFVGLHEEHPSYMRSLEISLLFSIFVSHFCSPGSGSGFPFLIWNRIQNTAFRPHALFQLFTYWFTWKLWIQNSFSLTHRGR